MKVKLVDNEWIELEPNSREGIYIDRYLKIKLDNILKIQKKNWDCCFIIDGKEGSGKSTLSFLCAWYLSKAKLKLYNITSGSDEAVERLDKLKDEDVLIIDEGGLVFNSRDSMMKEQRQIIKIMNVIRQKKMTLIIVAPSFFDMIKYISIHRSRFLLHIYTDKNLQRGRFSYFGEKKKEKLFMIGKKNFNSYRKPKADFRGGFTKFLLPFDDEYQKIKRESLMKALEVKKPITRAGISNELAKKHIEQRNFLIKKVYETNKNMTEISKYLEKNGTSLSIKEISGIINSN